MIIKRYTGEAFETLYPRTITTRLFNNAGTTRIFDSNDKIGLNFLPDSVFDSLYFYQTVGSGDGNLNSQAGIAIDDAYTKKRNPIGYYWLATAEVILTPGVSEFLTFANQSATFSGTSPIVTVSNTVNLKVGQSVTGTNIAQNTRIASITNATTFVMDKNPNQSGTSVALSFGYHVSSAILGGEESQASSSGFVQSPDTVTIETGDWFILNILTGTGTVSEPYIAQFSIVNNTYELMKGAVAPVMSGEVIVTEAVAGAPGLVPGPSAEDYLKFLRGDGTWQVATENSTDAFLLDRENHEGTQDASTISDFDTAVAANSAVTANTAKVTNADHTGDVTGTTELTIGDGKVSFSKIQDVSGYSVMGRSGSTTAAVEAIQASINGHVLRRTTSGLDFGTIAGDSIDSKAISFEKIQDSGAAGLSVIGRSANSSGAFNEIAAGTNGHVLTRISDNSLGFGQVKKAGIENGAVDTDQLAADSVSNVKLANMAAFKIKGNNSDIEADPGDLSPLQIRDMSNLVAIFIGAAMENPNNENDKTNTPVDKSNGMVDGSAIPTGTIWYDTTTA